MNTLISYYNHDIPIFVWNSLTQIFDFQGVIKNDSYEFWILLIMGFLLFESVTIVKTQLVSFVFRLRYNIY